MSSPVPEQIGKYRILERIGRGGMGTVYKAHDPVLDRLVAIKVISSEGEVTDELKARFYREAQACAKLSHPNIVVVHDLGEAAERLYIVMEFLEGEELKHVIAERRPVPLETKLAWMRQVCEGLHYAHQKGVIHRDVKPGNIFVLRGGQVKILDFGIARIAVGSDPGLTRTGLIMGTLRYMSPEQARGRVDHRSDMFSVGAVLYELLAHRAAFDSEDPIEILEKLRIHEPTPLTELDPAIPAELSALVERALRKDPAQRFPDLGEVRDRLDAIRRELGDETARLAQHVRAQIAELRGLETTLGRLLGQPPDDETVVQAEGARADELRTQAGELGERLTRLRARVRQVEGQEPALARADERLRAGDGPAAVAALEEVLRAVPEHARAQARLAEARRAAARAPSPAPVARPVPASPPEAPPVPAGQDAAAKSPARPARRGGLRPVVLAGLGLLAVVGIGAYYVLSPPAPRPAPEPPPVTVLVKPAPPAPSAREEAETAQRAAVAAREAAARGDAERLGTAAWAQAVAREREADGALGRGEFALAQGAYREAQQGYERAAGEARQAVVLLGKEVDARRVQERTAEARRAAEVAAAPRLAPPLWERAAGLDRDGERALKQKEFDRAQGLWRDAEQAYRAAESEAAQKASTAERERLAAVRRDLEAAEQVGAGAAAARREAEQAHAARYAIKTWALAREREAEGQAALERKDYPAAQRRLREAQEEYQRASREAQQTAEMARERPDRATQRAAEAPKGAEAERQRAAATARPPGEETTRLRTEVERLRESVASTREQALRIGADRLAKESFDAARTRESEAAALERQQNLTAAREAYQDAAQRFGEALSRAQVTRPAKLEADQARARMQAVKQRARSEGADYRAAITEEQRGDAKYDGAAFKEAAGHFRAAQQLYARAGGGPGLDVRPGGGADPRTEIRSVLDLYRQAIEEKDVVLFRRVRPGLPVPEIQRSFEQTKSHKVDLAIESIDVKAGEAEARGRRVDVVVQTDGQTIRNEQAVVFKLRRRPAGWVIEAVN